MFLEHCSRLFHAEMGQWTQTFVLLYFSLGLCVVTKRNVRVTTDFMFMSIWTYTPNFALGTTTKCNAFFFIFRHKLTNQLPASGGLVADSAAKTTLHSKVQRVLTGCVGTVCPAPEVVLQQLVRPCGTGAGHQPHGGLVKKHLADVEKNPQGDASSESISTSCLCSHL